MKQGTVYAARITKAYARLRSSAPEPEMPEPLDPLRTLAGAILGVGCSDAVARQAVERLLVTMVDWNEIRVSNVEEVSAVAGEAIPDGTDRCRKLIRALQSIFDLENRISLDRLTTMGRREARQVLDELDGVDEYAAAYVLLWTLGGHAIPVNDRLLHELREARLVHATADRAEVQAFLERNVNASDAKGFCLVMDSFTAAKRSKTKRAKTGAAEDKTKAGTRTARNYKTVTTHGTRRQGGT